MNPPRLLAVAMPGWQEDPAALALALRRLARELQPLGRDAAVYLRVHDALLAQWRDWLERLDPRSLRPLRIGVTALAQTEQAAAFLALLQQAGVAFVHLPTATAPQPWLVRPPGIALSRAWHAGSGHPHPLGSPLYDWTVVSPLFATPTKPGTLPLGWQGLAAALREAPGRIVALGGIDANNAGAVLAAGVSGVACLRAAWTQAPALCRACLPNA